MNRSEIVIAGSALLLLSACGDEPGAQSATTPTVADLLSQARAADGSSISWREHRIDDQELADGIPLRGADGLKMADLDGDGFLDVVSVHEDSSHLRVAYGSASTGHWDPRTLAEGAEVDTVEDVAIGDLNRDGHPDLIVACEEEHLLYLQNPGDSDPGGVRDTEWPRLIVGSTQGRGSWIRVFFADLDLDGDLEVTAPNKGAVLYAGLTEGDPNALKAISWFDVDGDPLDDASWTEHVLKEIGVPITARPVDLDGDGDLDILGGSRTEARIFWFENLLEEPGAPLSFQEHPINVANRTAPHEPGAKRLTGMNVDFADLDLDGDLDIVLQETPFLNVWLEQPGAVEDPWTIHPIGELTPDSPTGVTLADIDGDSDLDLITGGYSQEPRDRDGDDITAHSRVGRQAWFENPGDARLAWTRHDISRRARGMFDMYIARDMDGDGDVDFVATRGNSGSYDGVFWLEQLRTAEPQRNFIPARENESRHLPLPQ